MQLRQELRLLAPNARSRKFVPGTFYSQQDAGVAAVCDAEVVL